MRDELSVDLMFESASRIFEEASFVFLETTESPEAFGDEVFKVEMPFKAPKQEGVLFLAASASFSKELAANMLGKDASEPDMEEKGKGALGEMLNMIAGVFIERLFGTDQIVQLGIPKVDLVQADAYKTGASESEMSVLMLSEEGDRIDFTCLLK